MAALRFPEGFEWSTATAAHQIEGGNVNNNWWAFEHTPGSGCVESSGDACDSWNRWPEDVAVLSELGFTGYRFSLEWSRIEPAKGEWSRAALDNYRRQCEALLAAGIEPTVTLHHFTTPLWATAEGGWTNADTAGRFADFAHRATEHLGDVVRRVCTLNEPNMVVAMGYSLGIFPPGRPDPADAAAATETMVAAHRLGVEAVRAAAPGVPVGITVAMMDYQAGEGGEATTAAARADEDVYLDATAGDDFVGVQTYSRMVMGPDGWVGPLEGVPVVESMGYEYWPEALEATIRRAWERTGGAVPILVTENGLGSEDDDARIEYVQRALRGVLACLADGIDVRGYTYWSLLDNFEWAFGYGPKFGIVEVDRTTFVRTPKPSARWLAGVIAANALPAPPTG